MASFPAAPEEVRDFYRELSRRQVLRGVRMSREGRDIPGLKVLRPEAGELKAHLSSGQALVTMGVFSPTLGEVLEAGEELLEFLEESRAALSAEWAEVRAALAQLVSPETTGQASTLLREAMEGDYESWGRLTSGISPALVSFFLDQTLRPFLRPLALAVEKWIPAVERDQVWQKAACPVCGRPPGLARMGEEGRRYLRCLLCDAEWLFRRLACPFCGNEDHEKLGILRVEGDEGKEIHFCDACSGYLKVVRQDLSGELVERAVEPAPAWELDLESLYLDLAAEREGLCKAARRSAVGAKGIEPARMRGVGAN